MYVRTGKLGRTGRLAGAHRLSGVRARRARLHGAPPTRLSAAQLDAIVHNRLAGLGYVDPSTGISYPDYDDSGSAAGTASAEAAAITAGGQILTRALTPVPTVSYNTITGQYTATAAGATSAPGLANYLGTSGLSSASIASYLPLLLIGGLGLAAVMMLKK
jgi:hypothetical protein